MTHVGRGAACLYAVIDTPPSQGGGVTASDKLFVTSYMRAHSMRNNNQILHGGQTRRVENFYTIDH